MFLLCRIAYSVNFRLLKTIYVHLLHNEELNDLYSSPNIVRVMKSRRMRWAGHLARMDEERGAYRFLVGKPEGKRPLGTPCTFGCRYGLS